MNSISHFEYNLHLHPSFSGGISGFLGSLIEWLASRHNTRSREVQRSQRKREFEGPPCQLSAISGCQCPSRSVAISLGCSGQAAAASGGGGRVGRGRLSFRCSGHLAGHQHRRHLGHGRGRGRLPAQFNFGLPYLKKVNGFIMKLFDCTSSGYTSGFFGYFPKGKLYR